MIGVIWCNCEVVVVRFFGCIILLMKLSVNGRLFVFCSILVRWVVVGLGLIVVVLIVYCCVSLMVWFVRGVDVLVFGGRLVMIFSLDLVLVILGNGWVGCFLFFICGFMLLL